MVSVLIALAVTVKTKHSEPNLSLSHPRPIALVLFQQFLQSWTKITGHLLIFSSSPLSPKINAVLAGKFHDRCEEEPFH